MRRKNTPCYVRKRKRSNRNSSDLETDDKPEAKRVDSTNGDKPPTEIENMEDTKKKDRSVNEIYELLLKISENQNTLKQSLEKRISDLEENLRKDISEKMSTLRSEIEAELENMNAKFESLNRKVEIMKKQNEKLQDSVSHQPTPNEVKQFPKLVFKNITLDNETDNTERGLLNLANEILQAIDLDISPKSVSIIGSKEESENGQERARHRSKVTLMVNVESDQHRSEILRNKRKLKDVEKFKYVYIEPDKSRHERIQEANIRQIIRSMPNLQIRGGRVMSK